MSAKNICQLTEEYHSFRGEIISRCSGLPLLDRLYYEQVVLDKTIEMCRKLALSLIAPRESYYQIDFCTQEGNTCTSSSLVNGLRALLEPTLIRNRTTQDPQRTKTPTRTVQDPERTKRLVRKVLDYTVSPGLGMDGLSATERRNLIDLRCFFLGSYFDPHEVMGLEGRYELRGPASPLDIIHHLINNAGVILSAKGQHCELVYDIMVNEKRQVFLGLYDSAPEGRGHHSVSLDRFLAIHHPMSDCYSPHAHKLLLLSRTDKEMMRFHKVLADFPYSFRLVDEDLTFPVQPKESGTTVGSNTKIVHFRELVEQVHIN